MAPYGARRYELVYKAKRGSFVFTRTVDDYLVVACCGRNDKMSGIVIVAGIRHIVVYCHRIGHRIGIVLGIEVQYQGFVFGAADRPECVEPPPGETRPEIVHPPNLEIATDGCRVPGRRYEQRTVFTARRNQNASREVQSDFRTDRAGKDEIVSPARRIAFGRIFFVYVPVVDIHDHAYCAVAFVHIVEIGRRAEVVVLDGVCRMCRKLHLVCPE